MMNFWWKIRIVLVNEGITKIVLDSSFRMVTNKEVYGEDTSINGENKITLNQSFFKELEIIYFTT